MHPEHFILLGFQKRRSSPLIQCSYLVNLLSTYDCMSVLCYRPSFVVNLKKILALTFVAGDYNNQIFININRAFLGYI